MQQEVNQEASDDFFLEQATVTPAAPVIEAPPAEPVAPVYTMPKIEPEIIKQWREDFKLRTEKIEADASQEVQLLFGMIVEFSVLSKLSLFIIR